MTTVKGKINKKGEIRRYFNCTGKSHKKVCTGTKVTIYAEDLEEMVYDCITEKFAELRGAVPGNVKTESAEINEIKLKIQSIEKSREQIVDMLLSGDVNSDMKDLLNQRATQLKKEQNALNDRMEEIHRKASETAAVVDFAESWKSADYECRKSIAALMIHEIVIDEDGNVDVVWNI